VDNPNQIIEVYVDHCENCQANLWDQIPTRVVRRQITELPEIKPVVIETRHYEVACPGCGKLQRGKLPEGLEAGRYFGPRLAAMLTTLHHEHHLSFKRLVQICGEMFDLTLSLGGAVSIVERAGNAVQAEAEAIGEQVRQSPVIGSDETSARVPGKNWWEWVFVGEKGEYHLIKPSRGYAVSEEFMGECAVDVWVCDCWKAQLNAPGLSNMFGASNTKLARSDGEASPLDRGRRHASLVSQSHSIRKSSRKNDTGWIHPTDDDYRERIGATTETQGQRYRH
jgi:transposase